MNNEALFQGGEWTKEHVIKLISLYEEHRLLYDTKHPLYKNHHARANALHKIRENLLEIKPDITVEIHFSNELKKQRSSIRSGSGADNVYQPTVWWFPLMNFMREYIKCRKSESNFELPTEAVPSENKEKVGIFGI